MAPARSRTLAEIESSIAGAERRLTFSLGHLEQYRAAGQDLVVIASMVRVTEARLVRLRQSRAQMLQA